MVQWVRLRAPNAGGPASIPGQGTRSRMHAATKSLHAATKSLRAQLRDLTLQLRPSTIKINKFFLKKTILGTSLVVQWLRIRLPMQGTRVRALVQEDPTCHGAAKPVHHNY